jgi:hypothetical protein
MIFKSTFRRAFGNSLLPLRTRGRKALLVLMHGCEGCKSYVREASTRAQFENGLNAEFKTEIELDWKEDLSFLKRLGVKKVPCYIIFDSKGHHVEYPPLP